VAANKLACSRHIMLDERMECVIKTAGPSVGPET